MQVEGRAGFGDGAEDGCGAVLEGAEGGVDEWAAVEMVPGKVYGWALLVVDEGAGVVELGSAVGGGEFEGLWELGDLSERREGFGGWRRGWSPQDCALLVDDGVDGRGDGGEETHAEAVAQAAERVLSGGPAEAEGRDAVVSEERGEEGDGDEGQAEVLGYVATHVGLVDEEGVEVGAADSGGAVAEDHAGGVFDALDGEAEGGQAAELAEAVIELLEGAGRVVVDPDEVEVEAGGADAGFGVGDAKEDDLVATLLEVAGEGGHGVDVSGAGEAEDSEPRHGSRPVSEFGPEMVTDGKSGRICYSWVM